MSSNMEFEFYINAENDLGLSFLTEFKIVFMWADMSKHHDEIKVNECVRLLWLLAVGYVPYCDPNILNKERYPNRHNLHDLFWGCLKGIKIRFMF